MKTSEAIRAASKSLNKDNWNKGSYFAVKEGVLCMCAHGALQAQENGAVRAALATLERPGRRPTTAPVAASGAAVAADAAWVAAAADADATAEKAAGWAVAMASAARTSARARAAGVDAVAQTAAAAASAAADADATAAAGAARYVSEATTIALPEGASKGSGFRSKYIPPPPWAGMAKSSWVCGLVGLTASFNDNPKTTLRTVKLKMAKAAKLAEAAGD